jgi:hypothetical protein
MMNYEGSSVNHPELSRDAIKTGRNEVLSAAWLAARAFFVFAVLWICFYALFRGFPYLSSGAEVIYRSKINQEAYGTVFPESSKGRRVLIFGDSKVLAGFVPSYFDRLSAVDGLNYYSYNSGYPARGFFVPQLEQMTKKKSGVPSILLLTLPWESKHGDLNVFHLLPDDHEIADRLFPFRFLVRDSFSFLITSKEHGGPRQYYIESQSNDARMLEDRGYYFISEQSHYPHNSLPDDFHLGSDQPFAVVTRTADASSSELDKLNGLVKANNIDCYYVPTYARQGELAPAPGIDLQFADLLRSHSSCKLLGPDYYLFPNRMFSDSVHLNEEGAKAYTGAVYLLLAKEMLVH